MTGRDDCQPAEAGGRAAQRLRQFAHARLPVREPDGTGEDTGPAGLAAGGGRRPGGDRDEDSSG